MMYVRSIKLHLPPLKKCQNQEGYDNLKVSVLQSLAHVPVDQVIGFVL